MTEAEWLNSKNLYDMLREFPAKWDKRKLWLFGCACFRRHWHLLRDERTRKCVELAEQFVDGAATGEELDTAWISFDEGAYQDGLADYPSLDSYEAIRNLIGFVDPAASLQTAGEIAEAVGGFLTESLIPIADQSTPKEKTLTWESAEQQERRVQTDLLRDIFGNPFRPITINPSWLTPTVVALTSGIYSEKAFDRMPILADALQDAGCDNEDILNHCRQPGEHTRGCWALDLLLDKS
jgi:hypothetical protein